MIIDAVVMLAPIAVRYGRPKRSRDMGSLCLALQLRFHPTAEPVGYHDVDEVMDVGIACRGNA